MHRRFFSVLFSAALLVVALPLAAGAQEGTAETTPRANDAAKARVEAATSNVSAETGNASSSGKSGSQQSSGLTISQAQTTEGSQSQAVTGDLNTTQDSNSSCQNRDNLGSIDESDGSLSFTTTGDRFRVSYDVKFDDPNDSANDFLIRITDSSNETVKTIPETGDASDVVIVNEGPDSYDLVVTVQPSGGATFDVTVEDCVGKNDGGNGGGGGNNNRNNNDNNNRFNNNRNNNDNAVHKQYEKTVEERIIKETIPNKGKLANTGGIPPVGVAFLSLAMVGLGISVLRFAIRRER